MSHKRFLSIYDEYADDLLSYGYGLGFAKEDIEDTLQDVILNLYFIKHTTFLVVIPAFKCYILLLLCSGILISIKVYI